MSNFVSSEINFLSEGQVFVAEYLTFTYLRLQMLIFRLGCTRATSKTISYRMFCAAMVGTLQLPAQKVAKSTCL